MEQAKINAQINAAFEHNDKFWKSVILRHFVLAQSIEFHLFSAQSLFM